MDLWPRMLFEEYPEKSYVPVVIKVNFKATLDSIWETLALLTTPKFSQTKDIWALAKL